MQILNLTNMFFFCIALALFNFEYYAKTFNIQRV